MKTTFIKLTAIASLAMSSSIALGAEVATFSGGKITVDEYKAAVEALGPQAQMVKSNPKVRSQYLNHLVDNMLLSNKAKAKKIDKDKTYQAMVDAAKRDILAKIYLDRYIDEQTKEAKLKEYFNKNKKDFSGKEVRASHILLKKEDKKTAEKVLKDALKKGADFAELAKKHSTGPSASRGGDLNYFAKGRMVPEFEKVAFSTPKDKVHNKLVETQFGWHIIKVTDVRGGDKVKFEDKKDEVARAVKRTAREDLLKELRAQAKVKVDEKTLESIKF